MQLSVITRSSGKLEDVKLSHLLLNVAHLNSEQAKFGYYSGYVEPPASQVKEKS